MTDLCDKKIKAQKRDIKSVKKKKKNFHVYLVLY